MKTSARYAMVIMFSASFCIAVLACTVALFMKLINIEAYLAVLSPFILVVREMASAYFNREDRKPEEAK